MSLEVNMEDKGSAEVVEMYCELCKKKGKHRSAEGYCEDCVRYFCAKCFAYHKEFLPDHKHKDKNCMPQDVCLNPCPEHADEIIKFFCASCSLFFCSTCKTNQHDTCKNVNHLPDLVHQLEKKEVCKDFKRDIGELVCDINRLESVITCDLESIEVISRKALSKVESTRESLIKKINDRVDEIKGDVKAIKARDKKMFGDARVRLSAIRNDVEYIQFETDQKLSEDKRCELFMLFKDAENKSKTFKNELELLKKCTVNKYEFEPSTEDEAFFSKSLRFGMLVFEKSNELEEEQEKSSGQPEPILVSITKDGKSKNVNIVTEQNLGAEAKETFYSPLENFPDIETQNKSKSKQLQLPSKKGIKTKSQSGAAQISVIDAGKSKNLNIGTKQNFEDGTKKVEKDRREEIPDVETQKQFIAQQLQRPLIKGEKWFILDAKWLKQWKSFVGYEKWDQCNVGEESANPGPIDNSPIFREGTFTIKEHLIDYSDYGVVPEDGWVKLVSWYGILDGQEPIERWVIEEGVYCKSFKIEVYLWNLKLNEHSNQDHQIVKTISRANTVAELEETMLEVFGISAEKEVRLWNRYMTNMFVLLNKKDDTLQDAGLYQGQVIVIEQRNSDGTWPRDKGGKKQYVKSSGQEKKGKPN